MNKFYSLIVLLFAVFAATAQPTLPGTPVACNANNCTTNSLIDVCPPGGSTVVSAHQGGVYNRGNNGNHLGTGAIWRYRNFANVGGVVVNAEVTVDAISNAILDNIDDDAAIDQAGVSIASFFSPRIGADQTLNGTNRRGYVQFTMTFFRNATGVNNNTNADFANTVNLSSVNYVHYDIDGNDAGNTTTGTAGSWFRETGMAKRITPLNPLVLASGTTDLVNYNYTDPVTTSWTGFAGSVCERGGVSRCAQITSSFSYAGSVPSITFRMGYDYNGGGNIGAPIRQYGSRLGCFNFPQQVTLPVKLLAFSGSYSGSKTVLNWETANEVNFDHYDIERGNNGKDYLAIGSQSAKSTISKPTYQFTDELAGSYDDVFYYRLRMVDIDGKYSYSNVIMVRRDQKNMGGMIISPNPVFNGGVITIRLNAEKKKTVDIRVIDNSGKIVLRQQNQLTEGINSIAFNNQSRLQSGVYTIQVVADDEILSSKLSVVR
ncbi:MAG: T9SS type A sorting domain-containing protein [Chitinophagaceae bacterium]